jgi:probable 2-oxoglutarate dehydrogenase E1 component DHKTD1
MLSSKAAQSLRQSLSLAASARWARAASSVSAEVQAYRKHGHEVADIDPLRLMTARGDGGSGLASPSVVGEGVIRAYTGPIGAEIDHLESEEERLWLYDRMEAGWGAPKAAHSNATDEHGKPVATLSSKRRAHLLMTQAEVWEMFLAKRFGSLKRYSGEGAESIFVALDQVFAGAASRDVGEIVIGMPHRGRLSLLVSSMAYPARKLFRKLRGKADIPSTVQGLDDVSSHVAASTLREYGSNKIRVSLLHNPSHLEAINPVAMGKTRAKRTAAGSAAPRHHEDGETGLHAASGPTSGSPGAMCVLVHGDGAMSGQGVVWESLAMARLPGYSVGGAVHLVVNNQVAFTAQATEGRSTAYCTDVAKGIGAPVLHVNGNDVEAVMWAANTAVEYRQRFGKDVFVDIVSFRRHGHNELDQPRFTQPAMYAAIDATASLPATYAAALVAEGALADSRDKAIRAQLEEHLAAELKACDDAVDSPHGTTGITAAGSDEPAHGPGGSSTLRVGDDSAFGGKWKGLRLAAAEEVPGAWCGGASATGFDATSLIRLGEKSVCVGEGFAPHSTLRRGHIDARLDSLAQAAADHTAQELGWATAEALAFASLLEEGYDVRLAGQDAQRGTFSHRHATLVCQNTGSRMTPLNSLGSGPQGKLEVVSSHLSEFACLGYELGHSMEAPGQLNIWEAQFGDFANTAQVIIDQFLSGSESKWLRQTGLVMLLPHGFDGAGPEHSSARIERFLQLANSPGWANAHGGISIPLDQTAASGSGHDVAIRGHGTLELPPTHASAAAEATPAAVAAGLADKSWLESANLSICQPSTPANYFHLLRRQVHRPFRKPLVLIAPKTLLRLKAARSSLADMAKGSTFRPVLEDPDVASGAEQVLLCSGRAYYELKAQLAAQEGDAASTTAVVRLEELAPFPAAALGAVLSAHPAATSVKWVQEEHANAGAWPFVAAHASAVVKSSTAASGIELVARPSAATPAVGVSSMHKVQAEALVSATYAGRA